MRVLTFLILFALTCLGRADLVINEVVSSNVRGLPDEVEADLQNCPVPDCEQWYEDLGPSPYDGEYPDWIELYNDSNDPLSLNGYGLSDSVALPLKWTFPEIVMAPKSYLVVFASGKDKHEDYLHTNFKLKRTGEELVLSDPQGLRVDYLEMGPIPIDHALARRPEEPAQWVVVATPTPGEANTGIPFTGHTDVITASPPGGFYERLPTITLTHLDPQSEIRYTTTGSMPNASSKLYTKPIVALFGGDRTIKAQCFREGHATSPVFTASYLTGRTFTMPVISLTMEPDDLWDDDLGIYTPGSGARESARVANYWQAWERPVHVEFFEPDGTLGFQADAGLRIFGWGSRSDPQKSLAVMFRDRYGHDQIDYPLFPDLSLTEFSSFVLRAAGGDSRGNGTFFRDPFASGLLQGRNIDAQAFRPAVVYLNGKYWGIQNIREKMNEDYLASHHPVDPDEVDMISRYWRRQHPVVIEGDADRFLAFEDFLTNNDFSDPDAYAEVQRWMDMDNFLEYTAAQIYLSNYDWPGNNNKNWMPRTEKGRWRWLMYDLDYSFGFDGNSGFGFDTLSHAMAPGGTGWPNPSWTTLIMRRLTTSAVFRHAFANRIADLANTRFHPDRAIPALETMQSTYAPEIAFHIDRWSREGGSIPSIATWERNIDTVRTFLERRGPIILGHVRDKFDLNPLTDVTLTSHPQQGSILVNSVWVEQEQWTGTYFTGVPITLTAYPAPGYRFIGWAGHPDNTPTISVDPATLTEASPLFASDPDALNTVLFHEIHTRSDPANDTGDWVELYNGYDQPIDLSGWTFHDGGRGNRFSIPEGTRMPPLGYLILCQDQEKFQATHSEVPSVGNLGFGLDAAGESLELRDREGRLVNHVSFTNSAPWPSPAGTHHTIALRHPTATNHELTSWGLVAANTPGETNSLNASARPDLTIRATGETIHLDWTAANQRVERSTDLQSWEPVPGTGTLSLMRKAAREFFRLKKVE